MAQYCHSDSALVKEQKRIEGELATFEKNLWGNLEKKDSLDSIAKADKNVKGKVKKEKKSNRRGGSSSRREAKVKEKRSNSSSSSASSGSARVTVRRQRH